jgi:FdhD protein
MATAEQERTMRLVRITRCDRDSREAVDDWIVREERFDLHLNGRHLVALVCLPCDLDAFIAGFLVNEGILGPPYGIRIEVDMEAGRIAASGEFSEQAIEDFLAKRTLTSGCGGGVAGSDIAEPTRCLKVDTDLRVSRDTISAFMRVLRDEASLYQSTGGAHIAALADVEGRLLLTAEDIGRHTAVDKVIGKAVLSGLDPRRTLLFCSGRLSSEITIKAIHARTPLLVSRAAPPISRCAARRFLHAGRIARGRRMNIYSVPERIVD